MEEEVFVTLFHNDGLLETRTAKPFRICRGWSRTILNSNCHLRLHGSDSLQARLYTQTGLEIDSAVYIQYGDSIIVSSGEDWVPINYLAMVPTSLQSNTQLGNMLESLHSTDPHLSRLLGQPQLDLGTYDMGDLIQSAMRGMYPQGVDIPSQINQMVNDITTAAPVTSDIVPAPGTAQFSPGQTQQLDALFDNMFLPTVDLSDPTQAAGFYALTVNQFNDTFQHTLSRLPNITSTIPSTQPIPQLPFTPSVNSQPNMTPSVHSQQSMVPSVTSQQNVPPSVKFEPNMAPSVNSQPNMPPSINSQPNLMHMSSTNTITPLPPINLTQSSQPITPVSPMHAPLSGQSINLNQNTQPGPPAKRQRRDSNGSNSTTHSVNSWGGPNFSVTGPSHMGVVPGDGMRRDNMSSNASVVMGSPFSATGLTMPDRTSSHKASEQRSRAKLKGCLSELCLSVPALAQMRNPTKATVLKKATEYLEETNSKYAEARQAAETLAREKEALKTEREALAAKLEISTITTLEVTDADHRFIFVDPTWEIVLGYSREEVVGQLVHDLVDCPTCPFMRTRSEHIKTSLEQGHEWSGITVGVRKNGRAFVCETTITPVLDANKSILQYITRRRNIHLLNKSEEGPMCELQRTQNAEPKSRPDKEKIERILQHEAGRPADAPQNINAAVGNSNN